MEPLPYTINPIRNLDNVRLEVIAFHSILHDYAQMIHSTNNGEERIPLANGVERLFRLPQNLYKNEASYGDNVHVDGLLKTNRRTYTLRAHCWADAVCPDNGIRFRCCAEWAKEILTMTEEKYRWDGDIDDRLDAVAHTCCIGSWARQESQEGVERALRLLEL